MIKRLVSGLAMLALLAGCGHHGRMGHHGGMPGTAAQHFNPVVSVRDGQISVSPDPLVFAKGERGPIVWRLPPGLQFAEKGGVTIDGEVPLAGADRKSKATEWQGRAKFFSGQLLPQEEIVGCRLVTAREFSCDNRNTRAGVYRYTLRVIDDKGVSIVWDPTVMNND